MTAIASEADTAPAPSITELFLGFLGLGIIGFGGLLPLARRTIVEERKWLNEQEFIDLLGLCQFLPGGNIMNLSVAVGVRFHGWRGGLASILGIIAVPTMIVVCLGYIYDQYRDEPHVQHLFAGLAAAAAGLLISMGWKFIKPLRGKIWALCVVAVLFVLIAVLRLPLLPVMLTMAPISVLLSWRFGK
ncbi:chromate transporter [Rhizobium oryzicola]|uniref:Chromate transporter n=1 Tax=Rhizobium oryzicola TaxID=1232668 RepID=A0ABT8SQP5_9HYPH|nr:chromate transporter [Rhizobium oryzicola]MDO1580772.1 chromate transporter [Rhizobium oryzicola]